MTISEEELQRIVATAVKVALNEIKSKEAEESKPISEKVETSEFEEDELDDAMRLM